MEVKQLRPHLWRWELPHPEWGPDEDWDEIVASYALVEDDALVLFDPLVPPAGSREAHRFWRALDGDVEHHGPPAILLTISWHARSSQEILDRYHGTRVWTHVERAAHVGKRVAYTDTFGYGEALPGGVVAQDADRSGEVVFWLPSHRALVIGDVLLGSDGGGMRLCPESWYHPVPREELVARLRRLLDLPIELLLPTHGEPVADAARAVLERALADA